VKLTGDQFPAALAKAALKPCYWLAGNEPLQLKEARDALWLKAKQQDFEDCTVIEANAHLDWSYWQKDMYSCQLFSSQRLILLNLASAKLSEAAQKSLLAYLQKPNPDVVLVVISPKLEQHAQTQKVVAVFEQMGVLCQFWPLDRKQLPQWIRQRLQKHQLSADDAALNALADFVEGNLLAAAQAIDFLSLLHPGQHLQLEHIESSLARQAKFDVFALGEAFLGHDHLRYQRMLTSLKAEGVEPVLVLWALVKEFRLMWQLSECQRAGQLASLNWMTLGIWDKKRPLYQKALQSQRNWASLLIEAAQCDVVIKGYGFALPQGSIDPWQSFSRWLT
jgi:DNA polymerase-3 subunit delta